MQLFQKELRLKNRRKVMKMKSLKETQLSTTEYYRNSFLSVCEDEVQLPDQNQSKRVVVNHPGGVNIIALDEQKRLLLVEQYRYPLGRVTLETPAGKIEPGEKTTLTAMRELEEETGYRASSLTFVSKISTTPGFCDEWIETYFAHELIKLENAAAGDEDEFINVYHLTKEEAAKAIETQQICDYKTIYAIQYLTLHQLW